MSSVKLLVLVLVFAVLAGVANALGSTAPANPLSADGDLSPKAFVSYVGERPHRVMIEISGKIYHEMMLDGKQIGISHGGLDNSKLIKVTVNTAPFIAAWVSGR